MNEKRTNNLTYKELMEKTKYSVTLNYFGFDYKVYSNNIKDIDRINYIYKHFKSSSKSFVLNIFLLSEGNSLQENLMIPNSEFHIYYRSNNDDVEEWIFPDTPFPPCSLPPLEGKFIILHGMAFISSRNKAIVAVAPSLTGKSTLMIEMARRGFKVLSDDLLFIDIISHKICKYPKPVGIRERGLYLNKGLKKLVKSYLARNPNVLTFLETEFGTKVWLIHLEDIYPNCYYDFDCDIEHINFLRRNKEKNSFSEIKKSEAIVFLMKNIINSGLSKARIFEVCNKLISNIPTSLLYFNDDSYASRHYDKIS